MDEQRQDNQLEPIYNSSVPIQDVTVKICDGRWRERVREISTGSAT